MANPIKIAKLVSKQVKKRDAIRTEVRKKAYSAAPLNVKSSTGKAKVNKKVEKLDAIADARTYGNIGYIYKKGKLIEKDNNHSPVKVKPRALTKVTKRALRSDKNLTKTINKIAKSQGQAIKPNAVAFSRVPKVPVKKRGK